MQTDRGGTVAAFLLVLLAGVATLSSTASDLDYSQLDTPGALDNSDWSNTTNWHTYRNVEYGFQISYPSSFDLAKEANTLVAPGAVITFIPTYDPSIDGTGAKTNLMGFSVTVGVMDSPIAPSQRSAFCLAYAPEHELNGLRDVGRTCFAKSYSAEGAAGNRYETTSYFMDFGGSRYEIALFVHSGSPGCYSSGAITIFDPAEIAHSFETMVGTFLPGHKSL